MMNARFMTWAGKRIRRRLFCRIERSLKCIPLEGDEICLQCFTREAAGKSRGKDPIKRKKEMTPLTGKI